MINSRTSPQQFDVAIVGAGPAGLVAALAIAAYSTAKVIVLDRGNEINRRERNPAGPAWVEGIGGAGLFSDGKLCLSLEVGGHLRDELPKAEKNRLLRIVATIFERILGETADFPPFYSHRHSTGINGIDAAQYPVLHIGTDRGTEVIRTLVAAARVLGVEVRSRSELLGLVRQSDESWSLEINRPSGTTNILHARSLILAMGKVGAHRQATICEQHGASLASVPMYIGVRLEADSGILNDLFAQTADPKIKLHFADGTKVKTHCAVQGGEIAPVPYENLPLAGGHSYTDKDTGRSGFAILWDGVRGTDNFPQALSLMRRISKATHGRLMAQRLSDLLQNRASTPDDIRAARPSFSDWDTGNISGFFPQAFTERLLEFLRLLEADAPALNTPNTILVAPAIEWWMRRVSADPHSMRSSAGIYVCGDGSGWSQGIVHAAATGIIAAEDILNSKVGADELGERIIGAVAPHGLVGHLLAD